MPNTTTQTASRKSLAVKRSDGEPLTRADVQYDLLQYIFSNDQAVFTDPNNTLHGDPPGTRVTFGDLYINTLLHSPRCSKASREKVIETPDFGVEFGKMSLLSNVGRINTTMAFFPEMRTALRTYHPVPSLQKANGNLQDAPRIKNILKSCCLENEAQGIILTPADVLSRSRSGQVPPTSIVNLLFTFASHAVSIAKTHFNGPTTYDFLDFFTPINLSSESRARAILWLCYHYYEAPSPNPFADEYARRHMGKIPALVVLPDDPAQENVDPPDEVEWGQRMSHQRQVFMENKAREEEEDPPADGQKRRGRQRRGAGTVGRGRGKGKDRTFVEGADEDREREPSLADSPMSPPPMAHDPSEARQAYTPDPVYDPPHDQPPRDFSHDDGPHSHLHRYASNSYTTSMLPRPTYQHDSHPARLPSIPDILADPHTEADPYSWRHSHPSHPPIPAPSGGRPHRTPKRVHRDAAAPPPYPARPYPPQHEQPMYTYPPPLYAPPRPPPPAPPSVPRRSMLEQAWHVVMTTDPLGDSDDEGADENTRLDYVLRLRIINRLRGKEPTPEPEELSHSRPPQPIPLQPSQPRSGPY